MKRREVLATAGVLLLAGCQTTDEATPTATDTVSPTDRPTTSPSPTRAPTATETATDTPTETATSTESPTTTRPPNREAADQLEEARLRLGRAVRAFRDESHRPNPTAIVDTTADSMGFNPSRVTGPIDDARLSLDRAARRATPAQQATVEALRDFADWFETVVSVQQSVVGAAAECRTALAGTVPHDEQTIRDGFDSLATSGPAADRAAADITMPTTSVSEQIERLESGDVDAKTAQLRAEAGTLAEFGSFGETIVQGMDNLRTARAVNYDTAIDLSQDAAAMFQTVERDAGALEVPASLQDERGGIATMAAEWRDHALDKVEDYRDARDD